MQAALHAFLSMSDTYATLGTRFRITGRQPLHTRAHRELQDGARSVVDEQQARLGVEFEVSPGVEDAISAVDRFCLRGRWWSAKSAVGIA